MMLRRGLQTYQNWNPRANHFILNKTVQICKFHPQIINMSPALIPWTPPSYDGLKQC